LKKENLGFITGTKRKRKKNKVAIVGFAPSTMADSRFLFDDPDCEIWGLNQLYMTYNSGQNLPDIAKRADRWFQIHHRNTYDANIVRDHSHHTWMTEQKDFPIYMQEKNPEIPMSVRFPKEKILEEFGSYFTNSISWEIALAIMEGFKEIHLYGIDMATSSEYSYERPSVEFFLGWAKGRGIKIIVPQKSDILKTLWLYPYEDSAPFRTKCVARKKELNKRSNMMHMQEQDAHDKRVSAIGKLDLMNELEGVWKVAPPENFEALISNFAENREKYRQFVNNCANEERGFRDQMMSIRGAAENVSYIEQTWENSAREMAVEKKIIEEQDNVDNAE
jgi:hypothetical protein